ncbi:MAG: 2-polyprenylphenol 6-hydroxylase [Alphaproteobacteria bacterium]|nr:2-polyprenylphenol 6-hydroxylase [Alphaproteobacteria bacterium]
MFRAVRNLLRMIGIARTLARHDALFPLDWLPATGGLIVTARLLSGFQVKRSVRDLRPGVRLAIALQELGPSFIKFGQMLSTRPDLAGETIADDLSTLQDDLPPFPTAQARQALEAELDGSIDELFESFNDEPVAAASIAQVHFAVTRPTSHEIATATEAGLPMAGRDVAVKILRPGIERAFERDLDLFRWIADMVERTQPRLRRLKPVAVIETFAQAVHWEMDLRMESAAAVELAENFADDPNYVVPAVDWLRTGRRVLTTERIDGVPIHDVDELRAAGHDLEAVVRRASENFFRQVFRDGFFHADMHPGNAFVMADGALAVVDFGIMGRIDRRTRYYLADMLLGFVTGDYDRVADVHFRAGYVPADKDRQTFKQAVRAVGEPIFDRPSAEISIARLLAQLFQVTEQFDMETQPQLLLLQKTMLLAEGVGRQLAPNANMWQLAQPLIEDWMRQHRGPEAQLAERAADAFRAVERLPHAVNEIERAARAVADGKLPINLASKGTGRAQWSLWLAIAALGLLLLIDL